MQILCTICTELVNQSENLYATKCGHIFHYHCLSQWLERSKSCPQCRNKVTGSCMFRLYPTISERPQIDAATLQSNLDDANLHLRETEAQKKALKDQMSALTSRLKENDERLASNEKKLVRREAELSALREQLVGARLQVQLVEKLQEDNQQLQKKMELLHGLQRVLNAGDEEVREMVDSYGDLRTVATFATALKRALSESEKKKNACREQLQQARQQLAAERVAAAHYKEQLKKALEKQSKKENKGKKREMDKAAPEQLKQDEEPLNKRSKNANTSAPLFSDNSVLSDDDVTFSRTASESPYLQLRRGSLALSALRLPPSELAMINKAKLSKPAEPDNSPVPTLRAPAEARPRPARPTTGSIFGERSSLLIESGRRQGGADVAYDGLGGHARADTFPAPSAIHLPRPGAKHRLKKPNGGNTINKMFNIPH